MNTADGNENFIVNGSFETWTGAFNSYTYLYKNKPGTSDAITGWLYTPDTGYTAENFTGITTDYGFGVAPTTNPFGEGRNIPDGDYALFIQRPGTVSTTISGLTVGESYVLTYYYDSRSNNDTTITTSLGDWTLQSSETVVRSRDFYKNTVRFIATEESLSLSFANKDYREVQDTSTGNWRLSDSTLLVDAVSLYAQTANAYSGWVRNLDLWKGDSSSTISSEQTYSHALNFGPNGSVTDAVLNDVSFKAYGGTNPTSDASGANFSVTGSTVNPDSGLQNNLEGTGSDALSKGFIYGLSQIQLNGLIPGMSYETTFFGAYWDNNVSQRIGRFTAPDGSRIEVDEQTFIENGTRYGGTFSWRGEASETGNLQFNVQNLSGNTFHLYALANAASPDKDVVMATGFGGLNGENNGKQIVGTTMDYANIEGNNTWQARGGYLGRTNYQTLCVVEDGVLKTGANCGSAMEFASED
ncbi:MAG: DUF642 domain-containing protein, partial [Planctomycetia bacterium]|nr:DUF642 domain-containing protein [Planctomycetia bacterium]